MTRPYDPFATTLREQRDRVLTGWRRFDDHVNLYPKNLVNIFSAPGVGKSAFALNIIRRVGQVAPCLYVTMDTPFATQARRWASLVNVVDIRKITRTSEAVMRYYMHEATSRLLNEGWTFLPQWNGDAHVSIDEIPDLVYSVKEYLGVAPRVIVVDAVSDAVKEQTYDAYSDAFNVLKSEVARRYGCTVISLHHAKKGKHPNVPAHGPDVEFTGYKQPDTVISMYQKPHKVGHSKEDERRRLLILKARDGKSDPSGREWVEFDVEWTRGARFVEKAASRGWTF